MTITTITYRRHVNTGNFESFEIEATATLGPGDDEHDQHATARLLQTYVDTLCQERVDKGRQGARGGRDLGEIPEL